MIDEEWTFYFNTFILLCVHERWASWYSDWGRPQKSCPKAPLTCTSFPTYTSWILGTDLSSSHSALVLRKPFLKDQPSLQLEDQPIWWPWPLTSLSIPCFTPRSSHKTPPTFLRWLFLIFIRQNWFSDFSSFFPSLGWYDSIWTGQWLIWCLRQKGCFHTSLQHCIFWQLTCF